MTKYLILASLMFSQILLGSNEPYSDQEGFQFSPKFSPGECVLACKKTDENNYKFFVITKNKLSSLGIPSEGVILCENFSLEFECTTCEVFCNPNQEGKTK